MYLLYKMNNKDKMKNDKKSKPQKKKPALKKKQPLQNRLNKKNKNQANKNVSNSNMDKKSNDINKSKKTLKKNIKPKEDTNDTKTITITKEEMSKSNDLYKKSLKEVNDKNITKWSFKTRTDIDNNRKDNGLEPIDIKKYGVMLNQLKQIFLKMNVMITDKIDPLTYIISNLDNVLKALSNSYSVNTQRSILTNLITLLTYSNNNVKAKDIKALEIKRKLLQQANQPKPNKNMTDLNVVKQKDINNVKPQ